MMPKLLSSEEEKEIRKLKDKGVSYSQIARDFSVSRTTIRRAISDIQIQTKEKILSEKFLITF